MINVLICGAGGRMGAEVFAACQKIPELKVVCGVDAFAQKDCRPFPLYKTFAEITEKVDVVVDFSSPAVLDDILAYAEKTLCRAVLCTTGYDQVALEKIKKTAEKTAIFRSANMSVGINLLIDLVQKAAATLKGFDVEIIEKHHNQKADAPSGTALMLADAVKDILPEKFYIYGREGAVGKRKENEIGIHAVRGGNIVGDHDVMFAGDFETVTLSHQATSRSVFATGAARACKFIYGKTAGLYNMRNLVQEL